MSTTPEQIAAQMARLDRMAAGDSCLKPVPGPLVEFARSLLPDLATLENGSVFASADGQILFEWWPRALDAILLGIDADGIARLLVCNNSGGLPSMPASEEEAYYYWPAQRQEILDHIRRVFEAVEVQP